MSGSYYDSEDFYINYTLKASLNHPKNSDDSQTFSLDLNVMEPPRMSLGTLSSSRTVHAKCCGKNCGICKSYGNITINTKSDKNFSMTGSQMTTEIKIDNSEGNE